VLNRKDNILHFNNNHNYNIIWTPYYLNVQIINAIIRLGWQHKILK
jgi:hypothetical protein